MQHLLKIFTIALFVLIFNSAKIVKAETLEDLAGEINDIREQISKLQSINIKEAIMIDKALKEIDQVMDFVDEKMAKVSAWYDNEWGFASRMCDLANYLGKI